MLQDTNTLALSRRSFLVTTGAFSVAVAFGSALDTATAAAPFNPSAWVTISEDNIVTIVAPMVEMGQGVRTSLPTGAGSAFRKRRTMIRSTAIRSSIAS
jgi:isoquinoline 1-oxidoreductase beta subunit